ncbi:hypothetical protein EV356DRAFT_350459 [Viridothelium virens]|uniref:Uncharacterized protein n=1 Tax=Viridothelium virens TaxID=1048519 RepID=A0A6A6GX68_VIRVR|nr:hypothetical protein EV356DRAFT_350459 [Viridothelium virens]
MHFPTQRNPAILPPAAMLAAAAAVSSKAIKPQLQRLVRAAIGRSRSEHGGSADPFERFSLGSRLPSLDARGALSLCRSAGAWDGVGCLFASITAIDYKVR